MPWQAEPAPVSQSPLDAHAPDAAPVPTHPGSDADVLFSGDRGVLPLETRKLLVHLLLGPFFDGRREPRQWEVLLRDEAVLRSRLHELFLELVIAHNEKVAFARQVLEDGLDAPILLRRLSLTFVETALLLHLRQHLTQANLRGERAVVSRTELLEHLKVYERERNADRMRFERQCSAAVDKAANTLNLLRKLRGGGERYEVSPTLALLFPAEEILALLRTYRSLQAGQSEDQSPAGDGTPQAADGDESPHEAAAREEGALREPQAPSSGHDPAAAAERAIAHEFAPVAPAGRPTEGLEAVLRAEFRRADALDARAARGRDGPADEASLDDGALAEEAAFANFGEAGNETDELDETDETDAADEPDEPDEPDEGAGRSQGRAPGRNR